MFQKIEVIGNLGKDPEMRYTQSGQPVTSFSVACNRKYTGGDGQKVEETYWFRVTAWGKQAEVCSQYLKKGSRVRVEGRLTGDPKTGGPRLWTGQDQAQHASFEINATDVLFLSSANGNGGTEAAQEQGEDIPF
jgi:single-strand DNA-binding protein